jgi:hypothetical protein
MDVKALIVGKGVADAMLKCADMSIDPDYAGASGIRRVGLYGSIPVWIDPLLSDDKVMVSYKADTGDLPPDQCMVDPRRDHPDGENWIPLSDGPRGRCEDHATATGRDQGTPRSP